MNLKNKSMGLKNFHVSPYSWPSQMEMCQNPIHKFFWMAKILLIYQ
jgi:hypothetical protein